MSQILETYLKIVRKFIPQKIDSPSIGLDIGVDSCKLVELDRDGDSFEILNCGIEPIENADTAASIKRLSKRLNLDSKVINSAIFGKGTLVRFIEMPRMALEDLKKSFELESDKYFPFARDQIFTDAYILDPQGKEKQMSVLVAAVKREIINERLQLFNNLGFSVELITINSIAVSNLFGKAIGPKEAVTGSNPPTGIAILDIGEIVSNLVILVDGLPRFTRDIFVGGHDLTKRISNNLGMSIEEAKKLKCSPGDRASEFLNTCDSILINLISETKLSFDYFMTERSIPISNLFLTGGTSLFLGINELFGKNLDVKVESWNPLNGFKLAAHINPEEVSGNSNRYGVALGLAVS